LPVQCRQLFQRLFRDQLQQRLRALRIDPLRRHADRVLVIRPRFASDVAAPGAMVSAISADFLESDDQQQRPKVAALGHIVKTVSSPFEETAKHRLDDIFGIEPLPQIATGAFLGEGEQTLGVTVIELRGGSFIPVAEFSQKRLIRRIVKGVARGDEWSGFR
jgi:hypothetical protein